MMNIKLLCLIGCLLMIPFSNTFALLNVLGTFYLIPHFIFRFRNSFQVFVLSCSCGEKFDDVLRYLEHVFTPFLGFDIQEFLLVMNEPHLMSFLLKKQSFQAANANFR